MCKFSLYDIEAIKDYIKIACNKKIAEGLAGHDYHDDYEIRANNIKEAERLIALVESLKGKSL